jgi:hypothetical protein
VASKPNGKVARHQPKSQLQSDALVAELKAANKIPFELGWGFGIVHCGEITPPDLLELEFGSVRCEVPGLAAGSLELTDPSARPTFPKETRAQRLSRLEYKSSTNVPSYSELFFTSRL